MGKFWEDYRWGGKKWRAGAQKRQYLWKIDEKLLWRAYRNSPMLFWTVPTPTPYGFPFPKIGSWQPQPKTAIAIISGMGKVTDCKFGRYIHRVPPTKSPWKIWEKRERGRIQGLHKFFDYPILSQEWVKLRTSNLANTFKVSICTKARYKFLRKGSVGISRDCLDFLSTPYYLRNG